MSIAAILKNEAVYIKERIEFHRLVGAGRFYLYDNDSTDNVQDIPAPDINNF
ncbi:TPA: glycosyltransferase family 2 protein [Candidatus Galligastranaerophilus faecipullorum]|nr:glycosyltransferase family 2 protein [Candidatus Galligastranaerophilus faecipullorum]